MQDVQQVRSICGSGLRQTLSKGGTDVGREASPRRQLLLFFLARLSFEDTHRPEMSLIQTVLDELAYFLSVVAFWVNVSYSWLK